jgi:hypothetical protein
MDGSNQLTLVTHFTHIQDQLAPSSTTENGRVALECPSQSPNGLIRLLSTETRVFEIEPMETTELTSTSLHKHIQGNCS